MAKERILIDVGHGGNDSGAVGNGLKEKDLNLKVAQKVKSKLAAYDAEVKLTRESDVDLSADQRVAIADSFNPSVCVSCHHNSFTSPDANGCEVIHGAFTNKDDKLAANISAKIAASGMKNRGAKTRKTSEGKSDYYFMIRRIWDSDTLGIIVEGGFISSPKDAALLKTDSFLDKEAQAIVDSLVEHLSLKKTTTPSQLTAIMGTSQATVAQMVSYALKGNKEPKLPSCTLKELAELFVAEAKVEGVRADVAWAQSLKETGYFKYGNIVQPQQNNYAGIGTLNNNAAGEAANFSTPEIGVRAQIQHLKAYASKDTLVKECVDPRFSLVTRGSAEFVEWLGAADNPQGKGWAYPGGGYGTSIMSHLTSILKEDKEVESNVPQWQMDAFDKLVQAGVITDTNYWSKKMAETITVGEVMGLLAKMVK